MLSHMTGFPSFLRLNNTLLVQTSFCLSAHRRAFGLLLCFNCCDKCCYFEYGRSCSSSCSSITYSGLCFQFFQLHIQKPEIAGSYHKLVFDFLSQFLKNKWRFNVGEMKMLFPEVSLLLRMEKATQSADSFWTTTNKTEDTTKSSMFLSPSESWDCKSAMWPELQRSKAVWGGCSCYASCIIMSCPGFRVGWGVSPEFLGPQVHWWSVTLCSFPWGSRGST